MSAPPPVNSSTAARQNAAKQGAAALAAQEAEQARLAAIAKANDTAISNRRVNSGFGNGRISYDVKGNLLIDGKLPTTPSGDPLFSSQRNQNQYLADRGFANTGELINPGKAAQSDFSEAPQLEPKGDWRYDQSKKLESNKSPELLFSGGQIKQTPNVREVSFGQTKQAPESTVSFFTPTNKNNNSVAQGWGGSQNVRNSAAESALMVSEANRAGKNLPNNENSDYNFWGSPNYKSPLQPQNGPETPQSKALSFITNYGQAGKGQNIRNTQAEQDKATSEAQRAFTDNFKILNTDNQEYNLWTNQKTPTQQKAGGIETPQSKALEFITNYGQNGSQNVRNSSAESALMVSEANRALAKEKTENVSFTSFNEPSKPNPSAIPSRPKVQATPFNALSNPGDVFPARELSFNDFVNTQASKGATFDILVNNKTVGEVKGPNSLSSIIAYEKAHPDQQIAVSAYYPDRETEFLSALKSNPSNYSNLPQSYWDKISSQGFIGQTNIKQVNNILQIQYEADTRASLGKYQGDVSQSLYIENENGAVSSFMRAPFSGTKIPTPWGNYTIPGGNKAQTSTIPSTSILTPLSDFWFKPYEFLGFAVIKIADRVDPFLGKLGFQIKNKVNTGIQKRVLYNDLTKLNNAPKNLKELKITLEPQVRQRPTFRSTNPTRTRLPSDIIKPDNALSKATGSASQFIKPNHLENVGPERTSNANKIMNDLLTPKPESTNPAASPNIFNNFFKGQTTAKGKPYAGNKAALDLVVNMNKNEGANVQPKAAGVAAIIRPTEPNTQLSPTSRQFFGEQFKGVYPESYLPSSSAFGPEVIKPEVYSNVGGGVFDASTFRNNAPTNYKEFEIKQKAAKVAESEKNFGFLIKEKPLVPIRVKNAIGQFYKATNPEDFFAENKAGRASRVENSFIGEYSEVFSNKGVKYTNERGDVFFVERGTPKGALGKTPAEQGVITRLARPSPSNELVFKGYYYKGTSPTYFSVFKYSQETDVKNLFGFGEQKITRGNKYAGKSPLEKYNLIAEQGQREGDIVGINSETGTFKRIFYTKPESTGRSAPSDILTGFNQFGRTIFKNAKGGNYYLAGQVKSTGPKILRGELSEKHDIVNIRFNKWLEKHPQQEPIGAKGVWADLEKSLPKQYAKAATFSTTFRETNKGFKGKSNSGSEFFKTKPEEKAPKGFEFFNKGSKSETVLIKKPLIRKSLTETKEQTDYLYGYNTTPPAKEGSILSGRIDDLLSSSNKLAPRILVGTKANTELAKILKSMNNQKEINVNVFSTKQTPRQKPNQSLTPKQLPRILQTPKQSQTPKQGTKQTPKMPTPLRPRTNTTQAPVPRPAFPTITTQILNPPRKPPLDNLGGFKIRGKNYKSKSGPTALFDLGISNPFFSSLNTKRGKVEF